MDAEPAFGADHACIPPDSVDRLIADWSRVRPDLDFSPLGVVARLGRARAHIDAALEAVFAQHGLSDPSFAVLVTLVRLDRPEGVPQRTLMDELGLTAGTISVRIDRLEAQELVQRRSDAADRRNTLIVITDRGRALFERVAPAHLENERRLLVGLDAGEQAVLATLLRKLLVEYEGARRDSGGTRLGLVLAPAHIAIAMRAAVGLPSAAGLLVREVADDGPAHGLLQPGDVLEQAAGRALNSIASLRAAVAEGAQKGELSVRVRRGSDALTVCVPLSDGHSSGPESAAHAPRRVAGDLHVV